MYFSNFFRHLLKNQRIIFLFWNVKYNTASLKANSVWPVFNEFRFQLQCWTGTYRSYVCHFMYVISIINISSAKKMILSNVAKEIVFLNLYFLKENNTNDVINIYPGDS